LNLIACKWHSFGGCDALVFKDDVQIYNYAHGDVLAFAAARHNAGRYC